MVEKTPISQVVKERLKAENVRHWASDNISEYISEGELSLLVDELTENFEKVMQSLIIDTDNDPNSQETAKRLAKMYVYELMSGRYNKRPEVTAFPNTNPADMYTGILNVKVELKSICSHHHQPVKGICFIGLLPSTKVIGLSKYARIAQWCARRGTLQEELTRKIADEIMKDTQTEDIGVYTAMTHGCMENRGVLAHSSTTQTTILHGQFYNPSVKNEWLQQIAMERNSKHSLF